MAQNYTDDCFSSHNVLQTDMSNIKNNFAALKSNFSGAGFPPNPVPGLLAVEFTRHMLCVRNEANSAWLDVFNLATGQPAYTLPTAAAGTKGGIKIGARLTMTGDVLSADVQAPSYPLAVNLGGSGATTASGAADNLSVVKRDHGHDAVGSLCFAASSRTGEDYGLLTFAAGSAYAGSSLAAASMVYTGTIQGAGGAALTGTWRALGSGADECTYDPAKDAYVATLFQRIA